MNNIKRNLLEYLNVIYLFKELNIVLEQEGMDEIKGPKIKSIVSRLSNLAQSKNFKDVEDNLEELPKLKIPVLEKLSRKVFKNFDRNYAIAQKKLSKVVSKKVLEPVSLLTTILSLQDSDPESSITNKTDIIKNKAKEIGVDLLSAAERVSLPAIIALFFKVFIPTATFSIAVFFWLAIASLVYSVGGLLARDFIKGISFYTEKYS